MLLLTLPVYPERARCACTHALLHHEAHHCGLEDCACGGFEAAGGLVPLRVTEPDLGASPVAIGEPPEPKPQRPLRAPPEFLSRARHP